jgi:hypothetical protein
MPQPKASTSCGLASYGVVPPSPFDNHNRRRFQMMFSVGDGASTALQRKQERERMVREWAGRIATDKLMNGAALAAWLEATGSEMSVDELCDIRQVCSAYPSDKRRDAPWEVHRILAIAGCPEAIKDGMTVAEAQQIADEPVPEMDHSVRVAQTIAGVVEGALVCGADLPSLLQDIASELEGQYIDDPPDWPRRKLTPDEVERALVRLNSAYALP